MRLDLSGFSDFYKAEKLENFDDLISFVKKFDISFYNKLNIRTLKYFDIYMPIALCFRACILKARKGIDSIYYYTHATRLLKRYKSFQKYFREDFYEAQEYYIKRLRPKATEETKTKISKAMSKLSRETILKRNLAISKGMKKLI
jgi:hypothetical protein